MIELKKRTGETQKFDLNKLEKSIRAAGVDQPTSHEIASRIKPKEGWSTQEVRSQVVNELKRKDPEAAERYELHKREQKPQKK